MGRGQTPSRLLRSRCYWSPDRWASTARRAPTGPGTPVRGEVRGHTEVSQSNLFYGHIIRCEIILFQYYHLYFQYMTTALFKIHFNVCFVIGQISHNETQIAWALIKVFSSEVRLHEVKATVVQGKIMNKVLYLSGESMLSVSSSCAVRPTSVEVIDKTRSRSSTSCLKVGLCDGTACQHSLMIMYL